MYPQKIYLEEGISVSAHTGVSALRCPTHVLVSARLTAAGTASVVASGQHGPVKTFLDTVSFGFVSNPLNAHTLVASGQNSSRLCQIPFKNVPKKINDKVTDPRTS